MAIILNDNVKVNAGKPVESKYLNVSNAPFGSIAQVNTQISISERYAGLTVNINGEEYWYKDGVTDGDLVPKGSTLTVFNPKPSVYVATTGDIDLTGGTFGGTIDGIAVNDADRVLVKDQTLLFQNGIYAYSAATQTFYRTEDFDGTPSGDTQQGDFTTVITGATNGGTAWYIITPNPFEVGVDPICFDQF